MKRGKLIQMVAVGAMALLAGCSGGGVSRRHLNRSLRSVLGIAILLSALLSACSPSSSSSSTPSGVNGADVTTATSSKTVGSAGGGVVLPGLATLLVPPGPTGSNPITIEAVTSPVMDSLAPEATPGFEFLTGVPKFRVRLPQRPTELVELAIAIPNLAAVLPATHNLVVVMGVSQVEAEDEEAAIVLVPIVGNLCEENTAVCVTLLPEWFSNPAGGGEFQLQIGVGRVPNGSQRVALHWWEKLFGTASAIAQEVPWRLWTESGLTPTGQTIVPDSAHVLHVGGTVTLSDNIPDLASPLAGELRITSDFGPRTVTGNASASTFHPAVDLQAVVPTDVFPVLDGQVLDASDLATNGKGEVIRATCGIRPNTYLSDPLIRTRVKSGQLTISYLHLSETSSDPQRIGRSGNSGSCDPHLDLRIEFTDEFGGEGFIDPWPLLRNSMERFVNSDGDPFTATCNGCRQVFPFQFALDIVGGRLKQPGAVSVGVPYEIVAPSFINWPAHQTSHTLNAGNGQFNLGAFENLVTSGQNFLRLRLCSVSIGGCRQVRTWRIQNNPAIVAFSNPTYMVAKTAGQTAITLTRTGNLAESLTVNYLLSSTTAVQGTDYTDASITPGTVRFEANQTTASIPITVLNNPANTTAKFLSFSLGQIAGNGIVGSPSTASLTITGSAAPLNVCEPDVPTYAPSGCELPRLVARNPYTPISAGQITTISDLFLYKAGSCGATSAALNVPYSGSNWTLDGISSSYKQSWNDAKFNFLSPQVYPLLDMASIILRPTTAGPLNITVWFRADDNSGGLPLRALFVTCGFQQEATSQGS